jgi:hypothetical protein
MEARNEDLLTYRRSQNTFNLNFMGCPEIFFNFPIYLQSVEIHSANGVLGSEGGERSAL